ncbi:MAG TPA: plastocyanin/azurin family copper-binding protein [Candidatus Dormibacteraeota bacterium]|nr:plastocyanin/azurin family copper-binding protein [Candidatus Dormibacteraeota bacterium]
MRSLATGLVAVALLAACGGSSGGGGGNAQPAGSIQVTMTEFKFDPSTISHASGNIVFWLVNSGTTQHDMAIRDSSGKTIASSELVSAGDTKEFDVSAIAAGTYTFFCTQPGHEGSGMKGTLTVT